jgi:hypothetical protein
MYLVSLPILYISILYYSFLISPKTVDKNTEGIFVFVNPALSTFEPLTITICSLLI